MKKLVGLLALFLLICVFIPLGYAQENFGDAGTIATLLPGEDFNEKIGSITDVRDVKSIKKSDNKKEGLTDDNLISIGGSSEVYAWFDNKDDQGILYYYTDADVVYLNEDSAWMFQHFHELQDISGLSNWDTSNVTNMFSMFSYCTELTDISGLSNWDTSSVTNMSSMFENCGNLTNISGLSGWDISSVTNMNSMFRGCSNLTDISGLSGWDTSSVTNMSSMFRGCSNLTGLSGLSWWSTSSVTNMNDMFSYCSELTDISGLSGWDTSSVTNMSSMFSHCNKLTDISGLSGWNTSSVTNMNSMFYDCKKLTDISGLSGWDISSVTNMNSMFRGCSNLTDISGLSNWDTSNVTEMSQMFSDCNELTDISGLSGWDTSSATNISSMFSYCVNLRKTDLNNRDTSKVEYMGSMFYGCSSLSDVSGLSGWNTSSVTSMHGMFEGCSSLTNISGLSNWNTSSVENMGSMFRGCSNLIDVSGLSGWDTSSVTNMEGMFAWSTSLSIIDLSSWNTSNETFMRRMFQGCNNLEKIYVSNKFTVQNAYNISMFEGCTKLVGGNGTTYDANHTDAEYARIDTAETPGYFTAKNQGNTGNNEGDTQDNQENIQYTGIIILKPGLNTFSTPAIVKSISFSNGGSNISFATMEQGQRKATTVTNSNVRTVIRPLYGYVVRNSNSSNVIMTIEYETDNSNSLVLSKELDAGWNFLGVTKTDNPFNDIANTTATMILDMTNGKNTNLIEMGKTFISATKYNLGKAYAVFVNKAGIYGGVNNYGDFGNTFTITDTSTGKNTVFLKAKDTIAQFTIKPSNNNVGFLGDMILSGGYIDGNGDYKLFTGGDISFRVDGIEYMATEGDYSTGILYEINEEVPSKGYTATVELEEEVSGTVEVKIIEMNGLKQTRAFKKSFAEGLVYIDSQKNEKDFTQYYLGIELFDDAYTVKNVKFGTGQGATCDGFLEAEGLSAENPSDGDDFTINNGSSSQTIRCISYEVWSGNTQLNNGNPYEFNNIDYPDYFKVNGTAWRVYSKSSTQQCIGMDMANVRAVVNGNVVTLTWSNIGGNDVEISILDPYTETYRSLGIVDISDGKFDYEKQWTGVQSLLLTNGCNEYRYQVDA